MVDCWSGVESGDGMDGHPQLTGRLAGFRFVRTAVRAAIDC